MTTPSNAPVFLVSPPRRDWTIRGRANVFAAAAVAPSADAARADWIAVCRAVEAAGGVCAVVDNDNATANSDDVGVGAALTGLPYCAEAGLCGRDPVSGRRVFVLPQLTPPHRQGEPAVVGPAVARLGLQTVELPDGVAFEGQGDVIRLGDRFVATAGVGPWARSSPEAFAHYGQYIEGPTLALGFRADPWFHGNTFLGGFVGADGDVVVIVCDDALLDDGAAHLRHFVEGARIVAIDADATLTYATNALQVNTTVLAPVGVPGVVVDAWRAIGLTVEFLELPALFRRGGGAAVCLTNRLDGVSAEAIPADMRLDAWLARQ